MHLGTASLLRFFRSRRDEDALVVATIIATEGSTYRKPGAMMLAARDGAFDGLISGGCLESDLLHHAARVFEDGQPRHVDYDMHAGDDLVWNLGIGCDGAIRLLLQRLDRADGFGFLEPLDRAHRVHEDAVLALVTRPGPDAGRAMGAWALCSKAVGTAGDPSLATLLPAVAGDPPRWRTRRQASAGADVLLVRLPAPTRVLICGAGPDAVPVAAACAQLDWDVTVIDHRPAFARPDRFPAGCTVHCARPADLAGLVAPESLDAALVMSHHLENDAAYLRVLAGAGIPYLGILGPRARRERLQEMAGCPGDRVFGPVGLDIGAELPAGIALAAAAEIHAVLNDRDGQPLTSKVQKDDR